MIVVGDLQLVFNDDLLSGVLFFGQDVDVELPDRCFGLNQLDIKKSILVGYDWGGRAACVVAALWPERVMGLVSINCYNIPEAFHFQVFKVTYCKKLKRLFC